jgi:antitoxin (DNA-binding transcriptional repressor) of toxin-antitoxin stability system
MRVDAGLDASNLRLYIGAMKMLTITNARANLSKLLEEAKRGEDIGIVSGDQIVALRPVTVSSDEYALREYGTTPADLMRFEKRAERQIAAERRGGKIKRFTGDLEKDLAD